jgi:hypothetical protein
LVAVILNKPRFRYYHIPAFASYPILKIKAPGKTGGIQMCRYFNTFSFLPIRKELISVTGTPERNGSSFSMGIIKRLSSKKARKIFALTNNTGPPVRLGI